MGNKQSTSKGIRELDREHWVEDGVSGFQDNSIKLVNKMTGEELYEYSVFFRSQQEYQAYLEDCHARKNTPQLVSVKYINEEHVKEICSFVYHAKVYIESIPLRLSDITDVPFPDNLYILKEALQGFHALFKKYGVFSISDSLICMAEDGGVKVWLNQNLSKCEPYFSSNLTENQMVWQLISLVDKVTDKQTQQAVFKDFIERDLQQNKLTFPKAINFLSLFAQKYKIQIPLYFKSIIKQIREDKGIFDSQLDSESMFKNSNRFQFLKESKVERVPTIHGSLINSESNRTYADRLHFNHYENLLLTNSGVFGGVKNRAYSTRSKNSKSNASNAKKGSSKIFSDLHKNEDFPHKKSVESQAIEVHSQRSNTNNSISEYSVEEQMQANSSSKNQQSISNCSFKKIAHSSLPSRVVFSYNGANHKEIILNSAEQIEQNKDASDDLHVEEIISIVSSDSEAKTKKNFKQSTSKPNYFGLKRDRMTIDDRISLNSQANLEFLNLELDPVIAADLAKYEAEQERKSRLF